MITVVHAHVRNLKTFLTVPAKTLELRLLRIFCIKKNLTGNSLS